MLEHIMRIMWPCSLCGAQVASAVRSIVVWLERHITSGQSERKNVMSPTSFCHFLARLVSFTSQ